VHSKLQPWIAVAVMLAACDEQVTPEYVGESLLTIVGSVEIADDRTEGRLIPALAFTNDHAGQVMIQEVSVRGEFPSDFRLDVFEPPPSDAFFHATHRTQGEPRIATGYVTAVTVTHPATISFSTEYNVTSFGCDPAGCDQPCPTKGCRVERDEWCVTGDASVPCYAEDLYCPTFRQTNECVAEPTGVGDPALKGDPWSEFAGFSQNYLVVDLEDRALPGSLTAQLLGAPNGVVAGYGLYTARGMSDDELATADDCTARAEAAAAIPYNADHGTVLPTLGFEVCGIMPALPFCAGTPEGLDAAAEDVAGYVEVAKHELGCPLSVLVLARVVDPENQSVSVIIRSDTQPPLDVAMAPTTSPPTTP
jgi:hypothetical protein